MKFVFIFSIILSVNYIVYGQNVGIGTLNPHISSILDIESSTKGFLPPRMDSIARNSIVSPVEGLTIYNTSTKSVEVYNGTEWYSTVHFIGESYGGGIVFYVYDNGQHGLIAAAEDQSSGIRWSTDESRYRAYADGIGGGLKNTLIILSHHYPLDNANTAASISYQYSITSGNTTYGDFYLPSKYELNLLYLQKDMIGGFSNNNYWSSTESVGTDSAWSHHFGNNTQSGNSARSNNYRVRAIRSF